MNRYISIKPFLFLTFLFLFPFINCRSQEVLKTVQHRLEKAQGELDSSRHEQALTLAKETEAILLKHFDERDSRMADTYSMIGICLLKTDPASSKPYLKRLNELKGPISSLSQAHIYFFSGSFNLVSGNIDESIQDYQKAISIYLKQLAPPMSI